MATHIDSLVDLPLGLFPPDREDNLWEIADPEPLISPRHIIQPSGRYRSTVRPPNTPNRTLVPEGLGDGDYHYWRALQGRLPKPPVEDTYSATRVTARLVRAFAVFRAYAGTEPDQLPPMIPNQPYNFKMLPYPHFVPVIPPQSINRKLSWRKAFHSAIDRYVYKLPAPIGLKSNLRPGKYLRHPALIRAGYTDTATTKFLKRLCDVFLSDEDPNPPVPGKPRPPRPVGNETLALPATIPDVPENLSLKGKTALVTGASKGIGYEVAKRFALHGISILILGCHTAEEGQKARIKLMQEIRRMRASTTGSGDLEDSQWPQIIVLELELLSHKSCYNFWKKVKAHTKYLDYAVFTAYTLYHHGFQYVPPQHREGRIPHHEESLQINVASNSYLSILIAHLLLDTSIRRGGQPTRLTFANTELHKRHRYNHEKFPAVNILTYFDDYRRFCVTQRHRDIKLLQSMWTREMSWRFARPDIVAKAKGSVIVNDVGVPVLKGEYGPENTTHYKSWFRSWLRKKRDEIGVDIDVAADDFFKVALNGDQGGYYVDGKLAKPADFLFTKSGLEARYQLWSELGLEILLFDRHALYDFWKDTGDFDA